MLKLSSLRYFVSANLQGLEDMNIFQRIIFKIRLRRAIKKDVKFTKIRENLVLPDKSFNELLKERF